MGHQRTLATLLLLIGVLLSGCAGDSKDAASAKDVTPRGDSGIKGRVLDQEQLPVRGATVEVLVHGNTTITDIKGNYSFDRLMPGEYSIKVQKRGYVDAVQHVLARPGEVSTLDFVMQETHQGVPYVETLVHDGQIACEIAQGRTAEDTEWTDCRQDGMDDASAKVHRVAAGAHRLLIEAQWSPTSEAASRLTLMVHGPEGTDLTFGLVQGKSVLSTNVSKNVLQKFLTNGGEVTTQMRAAPQLEGSGGDPPPNAGAAVAQSFTVYVTAFYFHSGTEDFTAVQPG